MSVLPPYTWSHFPFSRLILYSLRSSGLFIYYIKRLLIIRETLVATRPPFPPPVPFSSYFLRLSTTLWLSGYEMRTLSRHISSRQRALPYMWQRRPSDLESVRSATHGILSHPNGSRLSTSSTLVSSLYGEDVHRPPLAHTAPARTWDFPMDRGPVLYSVS